MYLAEKSKGIPRYFIRYLHNAMSEAAFRDVEEVSLSFIKDPKITTYII